MALEIRPFTLADVAFGHALTEAEGWHRLREDWARLVRLEPRGVFKAVLDGRDAGTAAVIAFDRVAWVHSVIVRKELRGRGIGDALVRACLAYLQARGVRTVKLDSEGGVEPFYERFGFRREYASCRLLRGGLGAPPRTSPLRPPDWRDVFLFDRRATGVDRTRALQAILQEYPHRSYLARERGEVRGYVIVRSGRPRIPIGPCVVADGDTALAADLLTAALGTSASGAYRVCAGGYRPETMRLFDDLGFARGDPSTRMVLGEPFDEAPAAVAMISAEKG